MLDADGEIDDIVFFVSPGWMRRIARDAESTDDRQGRRIFAGEADHGSDNEGAISLLPPTTPNRHDQRGGLAVLSATLSRVRAREEK